MSPAERRTAAVAGSLWGAVYALICFTGQRFSTAYLGYGWQLVPYEVLSDDPIRSVWYLHIQPPLWNLVIGVTGRWSPLPDAISLQFIQASFGALAAAMLAVLLLRMRARPWLAITLALVGTLNPEYLRNAFEPTYEIAVGCLLVGAALAATSLHARPDGQRLVVLAGVLTTIAMTRSLYHPVWVLGLLGLFSWAYRQHLGRRQIAAAFALPVLLLGGWTAKNAIMFGEANLSSWFGMNLQRAVIPVLPRADLEQLFDAGNVSEIAMIGPFGNYGEYRDVMPPCVPAHDHPSLTVEIREFPVVVPNLNFECFLPVYEQAGNDARAVIRAYPGIWLEGRLWSARTWFAVNSLADQTPSWPLRQLGNAFQIVRLDVPGDISTSGWGTPIYGDLTVPSRFSLSALNLTVICGCLGLAHAWRMLRGGRPGALPGAVHAFVGLSVSWTFVVGVVGELGEQARFRTMTDPLVFAIGLFAAIAWLSSRFGFQGTCVTSQDR